MMDLIIITIVVLIVGLAGYYMYREKKRGNACVGCPYGGQCSSKNCGCTGSCNSNISG